MRYKRLSHSVSSVAPGSNIPSALPLSISRWLEICLHLLLCAVWVWLGMQLMIVDVWDETNGLAWLHNAQQSLAEKFTSIWTPPVAFFRPLPTAFAAIVIHFTHDDALAWRLLRAANMVVLLATLFLLQRIRLTWGGPSQLRALLLTVLVLYSGSACIVAGWYTNCFDAWALFFLVAGITCLATHRPWWAGTFFAIALFCKETAVLIFPFLLLLKLTQRVTRREAVFAVLPVLFGMLCYFPLRSMLIDFGSSHDIHAVRLADVWPTLVNFTESFWRQTMKLIGPPFSGFVWLGISVLTLCRWRARVGLVLFLVAVVPVYLGMFTMAPQGKLIHYWNFIGRLYLIPGVLMLLLLVLEGRLWGLTLLLVPVFSGAWVTYHDHLRFQQTYQQIRALAASTNERPLHIYTEESLPNDAISEVHFGHFPEAQWELDHWSGTLRQRPPHHPSQSQEQAPPP